MTSSRSIASMGIRSQLTWSAKGSLTRTPSTKTLSPGGVPIRNELVNPR